MRLPISFDNKRRLARKLNNYDASQALQIWEEIIDNIPNDLEANHDSGIIAFAQGQTDLAEKRLSIALDHNEAHPRIAAPLLRHFVSAARFSEARRIAKIVVRRWPREMEAWALYIEVFSNSLSHISGHDATSRLLRRIKRVASDPIWFAELLSIAGQSVSSRRALEDLLSDPFHRKRAATRLIMAYLEAGEVHLAEETSERYPEWMNCSSAPRVRGDLEVSKVFHKRFAQNVNDTTRVTFLKEICRSSMQSSDGFIVPRRGVVLHIIHSLAIGGSERQCVVLSSAQARRGGPTREVVVLRTAQSEAGRRTFSLEDLRDAGVINRQLSEFLVKDASAQVGVPVLDTCVGPLSTAFCVGEIKALVCAMREIRPWVVHTWTPRLGAHGSIAAALAGVPRVVIRAGSVAPVLRKFKTEREEEHFDWLRQALEWAVRRPNVVLASNARENLSGWRKWLHMDLEEFPGSTSVTPNVLDPLSNTRSIRPEVRSELRERLAVPCGTKIVGAIFRIEREKGPDLWCDVVEAVCRRRSDVLFALAGDGRLRGEVLRNVAKRGLDDRVRLIGAVTDEIPEFLSLCHVVVLTSHYEGLPNAILEAQSYGVPVVAAGVGGVREAMVSGQTGFVVPREPEYFATAIDRLCDDVELHKGMGESAKRFAFDKFGVASGLRVTDECYFPRTPRRYVFKRIGRGRCVTPVCSESQN